jgi:hypothetical protein
MDEISSLAFVSSQDVWEARAALSNERLQCPWTRVLAAWGLTNELGERELEQGALSGVLLPGEPSPVT